MLEVQLFATLRENRGKILHLNYNESINGYQILKELNIDPSEVAIFLISGFHSKLDDPIKEEDIICIFPPVGGG